MVKRSAARTDFLAGILVTIVEGGSDFWANFDDYRWAEDDNHNMTAASVSLMDQQDPETWKDVTLDTIALGISIIKRHPDTIASAKGILEANKENDAGNIDSYMADDIIQMALFGELVYG